MGREKKGGAEDNDWWRKGAAVDDEGCIKKGRMEKSFGMVEEGWRKGQLTAGRVEERWRYRRMGEEG